MFVVPFQLIVVFVHFRFVQLFKKTTTKTAPEHNNRHKKNDRPPPDLNWQPYELESYALPIAPESLTRGVF